MSDKLPKLLRKAPIIEALAEVRFAPSPGQLISSVLPGLMFSTFKAKYPNITQHPSAQLPVELKEQNAELRYLPNVLMAGKNSSIVIGGRVLGIMCTAPYPGWGIFRPSILEVWKVAKDSGILGSIERFSVKYVNLIVADMGSDQLSLTNVKLQLDDHLVSNQPSTIRTEFIEGPFVVAVTVVTQATTVGDNPQNGLILDIDVICNGPFPGEWDDIEKMLEDAHALEKKVFFNLLTQKTIDAYEPEY